MKNAIITLLLLNWTWLTHANETPYFAGVAQVDITPDYPIRLNGFGFRREESAGIQQSIWAKALAMRFEQESPVVLITLDSLGIPLTMTQGVRQRIAEQTNLPRDRIVISFTHSHTTPKVNGASDNIFSQAIPAEHQEHIDRYTKELADRLVSVAVQAVTKLEPAKLSWGTGAVGFAKNRRTAGGPVDHDLPVLLVQNADGQPVAIYTSYACHCVTLSHNLIGGDWAGYAQEGIQRKFPGVVAMVAIGAGSDSNPDSGVTGDRTDIAQSQGMQIADEVQRVIQAGSLQTLNQSIHCVSNRIPIPLREPPTAAELQDLIQQGGPAGYNAQTQLAKLQHGRALQNTIDYSIQTLHFGQQLAMTFLAGEVCVDYSLRLKTHFDRNRFWVVAYANDFCAYIPSQRLLQEGGYGGGAEIPYFALPNTIAPGVEQRIVDEVQRQVPDGFLAIGNQQEKGTPIPAKSPADSLQCLSTHPHLQIELVASEPLITDPVAIDFGIDGRLWVAEMNDYARGPLEEFPQHGRIRLLTDTDRDGTYDSAATFLDGLRYPTDVKVWKRGILVCDSPDIWYAEDTNGDGQADVRKKLFSGFATHNAQARVNSLVYGLDNWLYGACGLFGGVITDQQGRTVDSSNRDFRITPELDRIEAYSGNSQQGRSRDDWDNWFGCTNGELLVHFPVQDEYMRRNPAVQPPASRIGILAGRDANQLFPPDNLVRFELSGPPGRPTSACGLHIYRGDKLPAVFYGNAFVCEPVNQLVHRRLLRRDGERFVADRANTELQREFLSSTDPWFRPVQVKTGLDGALYVVDMYRYVIEHPVWIPESTKASLDVFAGQGKGRIYRMRAADQPLGALPDFSQQPIADWVPLLDHANGAVRDMAQQQLVWNAFPANDQLLSLVQNARHAAGRSQALWTLAALNQLDQATLLVALNDKSPDVQRQALRLADRFSASQAVRELVMRHCQSTDAALAQQAIFALGEFVGPEVDAALIHAAIVFRNDETMLSAVFSSLDAENIDRIFSRLLDSVDQAAVAELAPQFGLLVQRMDNAEMAVSLAQRLVRSVDPAQIQAWHWQTLAFLLENASAEAAGSVLSGAWEESLQFAATDNDVALNKRLAAVDVLGATIELPAHRFVLQQLLSADAAEVRLAAIARLAADRNSQPWLALRMESKLPTSIRSVIIQQLLERKSALPFLKPVTDRHPDWFDQEQWNIINGSTAENISTLTGPLLEYRMDVLQRPGDAASGQAVYQKHCALCHESAADGQRTGPDLTALTNRTPTYVLDAVLLPSQAFDARYVTYNIDLKDGRRRTGLIREETSNSLTLVDVQNQVHVLLRNEMESIESTGLSLMPSGLADQISPADMRNLLEYVTSHRR